MSQRRCTAAFRSLLIACLAPTAFAGGSPGDLCSSTAGTSKVGSNFLNRSILDTSALGASAVGASLGASSVVGLNEHGPGDVGPGEADWVCGHRARALRRVQRGDRGPGNPQPETPWTDVLHTKLDVEVNLVAHTIYGTVTITAQSQVEDLSAFVVYLDPNGGQMGVSGVSGNVAGPDGFTHVGDKVTVSLDQGYDTGETFTVSLNYGGVPNEDDGMFWGSHGSPSVPIVCTNAEPFFARYWWVGKDVLNDKCTFDIWVTVPSNQVVASNGILRGLDLRPGDRFRYRWEETYPMAPYLCSLAIADYDIYSTTYNHLGDTMPMTFYILPENNTPTWRGYCDTYVTMIEVYADTYGQYPFINEKGGMAHTPTLGWYMEHQTIPSMPSFATSWINAHELAHQWWGDMITCETWGDIWLNEGITSFSESVWEENRPGGGTSAYWSRINARRPWNPNAQVFVTNVNNADAIFDSNAVYNKGAWVTHMLRHVMGDDAFFQALRDYRAAYQGSSATTTEFINCVSDSFGHDLTWFTEEWVMHPGSPAYEWNYSAVQLDGRNYLRLAVWQKQDAGGYDLFTMPIDVRVTAGGTSVVHRIWNDGWTEYYVIPIHGLPTNVELDEQQGTNDWNWVLTSSRARVYTSISAPPVLVDAEIAVGGPTGGAEITLLFSEDIGGFEANDLTLVGLGTGSQDPDGVQYNATTRTATASFQSLPEDAYTLTVLDDHVVANGKLLDGEVDDSAWYDDQLLPSGDGQPGGDAVLTFRKSNGDIDGDGDVDLDDLTALVAVLLGSPIDPAHVARADVNVDGYVDGGDIAPFVDRLLQR